MFSCQEVVDEREQELQKEISIIYDTVRGRSKYKGLLPMLLMTLKVEP